MALEAGVNPSTSFEVLGAEPARGVIHPVSGHVGTVPNFGIWSPFGPEPAIVEAELNVLKRAPLSWYEDATLKDVNPGGVASILADGNSASNYLHVGAYDSGNPTHPHRALMLFPTSGLSGTVVSAKCRFYHRPAPDPIGEGYYQLWVARGNEVDRAFEYFIDVGDWNVIYPVQRVFLVDASCQDTYLSENQPAVNFSAELDLQNLAGGTGFDKTTILKFLNHGVPSTATIISAGLKLTLSSNYGGIGTSLLDVQRLLRDFVHTEATWNEYSAGNAWTTGGAAGLGTDYSATDQRLFYVQNGDTVDEQWVVNVTGIVQAQVSAAETHIKFRIRERAIGELVNLGSTDGFASRRPSLVINYQPAGTLGVLASSIYVSPKLAQAITFPFSPDAVQVVQDAADAGEEVHAMLKAMDETEMGGLKLALISSDETTQGEIRRPKLIVTVDQAALPTGFPGQHNRSLAQLVRP